VGPPARDSKPIASFGSDGRIDLREGLGLPVERASVSASTPGSIFEDLIIFGSSVPETLPGTPGHIRAFDVRTGKLRWIFHTIPQPGEFGSDTWPKEPTLSGGANAWAGVTVDQGNAMVFAATGSASFDWYGINRHGDNLFADRSSPSMPAPASACGTTRSSSTTCGTGTCRRRRTW